MDVKVVFDFDGLVLEFWKRGGQFCFGSFEGIFCNLGDKLIDDDFINLIVIVRFCCF